MSNLCHKFFVRERIGPNLRKKNGELVMRVSRNVGEYIFQIGKQLDVVSLDGSQSIRFTNPKRKKKDGFAEEYDAAKY